jgi:hypothetical protein
MRGMHNLRAGRATKTIVSSATKVYHRMQFPPFCKVRERTAGGYSVITWSAHSISDTKTGGLPNFAP